MFKLGLLEMLLGGRTLGTVKLGNDPVEGFVGPPTFDSWLQSAMLSVSGLARGLVGLPTGGVAGGFARGRGGVNCAGADTGEVGDLSGTL